MPAKRIPWIKFYPELLEHEKFGDLSDAVSWTWVNIWGKASQQPVRWRFASAQHAAKVTGRPVGHVRQLITARLLDERDDGLWVHDWQQWQNRYPSDFDDALNAPSTDADYSVEDSANSPPMLREHSVNGGSSGVMELSRAAERAKTKKGDIDAPNGAARAVPKPNRSSAVIDAIRERGQEPNLTTRDHAAIKQSAAKPELIAEVYCAVFDGDYGDDHMQRRLSVHEAIGWIDGYRSWKTNGAPKAARFGRPEPPKHIIDRTGEPN